MYSWVDGRRNLGSRNLPALNFISKSSISFMRNAYEVNNFNRLPVIKEEEGYVSDDEVENPQPFSESNSLQSSHVSQKDISDPESSNSVKTLEKFKESKSYTKLPPLVNINCMMNPVIKQTRPIWDSKFGKRLIYGRDDKDSSITEVKKVRSDCFKSCTESFEDSRSHKLVPKRKAVRVRSDKSGRGERRDFAEITVKKCSIAKKEKQNSSKKKPEEFVKSVSLESMEKFSEKSSEISTDSLGSNVTNPTVTKSQRFLTEYIQGILEGRTKEKKCEHCNETFQDVVELCNHKKQHQNELESCLLCNKVFFNPSEFIQHLLTHEGVDRFSCKKCKKYFPSLRKYKQHCVEHHFVPQKATNKELHPEVEDVKKCNTKLECKRCKMEFDGEKKLEAHRRNHMRKDLAAAYLLSSKTL